MKKSHASSLDSILFGTARGGSMGPGPTGFARVPYVASCGQPPIPLPEPAATIEDLADAVDRFVMHHGIRQSLQTKLQHAQRLLADADPTNDGHARSHLEAFIHEVEAQRGKEIAAADADLLIALAGRVIDSLPA